MHTLITGSSGDIGSRLVPRLNQRDIRVRGVDRDDRDAEELDSFIRGDLCNPGTAERAVRGCDQILHLAAAKGDWGISEEEYFRDFLLVTRNVIEAGL